MDAKKKQMLLIAILAVGGLGWGSYYFFIRDSGPVVQSGMQSGPSERRVRQDIVDRSKATNTRKTAKRAPTKERVAPNRKVREASNTSSAKRKTRRGKEKKVKKKVITPAA